MFLCLMTSLKGCFPVWWRHWKDQGFLLTSLKCSYFFGTSFNDLLWRHSFAASLNSVLCRWDVIKPASICDVIKSHITSFNKALLFRSLSETPREASLLLILKWGGELTPSGRRQAEELGKVFRCMYPGGQGKTLILILNESKLLWLI